MNEFVQSGLNLNITIWHCYKHMPQMKKNMK